MWNRFRTSMAIAGLFGGVFAGVVSLPAQSKPAASAPAEPAQLGALARANLAKPRPKPPFDLTGTWMHGGGANNGFRFSPPPGFKLTPAAQVHYDAAQKASKEGKVYRDD